MAEQVFTASVTPSATLGANVGPQILKRLDEFRRDGWLIDTLLQVDGESHGCHGVVLASAIPSLQDKIVRSRQPGDVTTVVLETSKCDGDSLRDLIEYAYTGRVQITHDNVNRLKEVSRYLEIRELEGTCVECINNAQSEIREFENKLHTVNVLDGMQRLRLTTSLTDVTVRVDEAKFPCHKVVLSACSRYFKAMFSHVMIESKENTINLKDCDPHIVEALLEFAYTSKIRISHENVQELMEFSLLFQFPEVFDMCGHFMRQNLHPTNCLGVLRLAEDLACDSLRHAAWDFTVENFTAVSQGGEFLVVDDGKIRDLLSADLCVEQEEDVFNALLRWVKHDQTIRQKYLPKLLEEIRFPFMERKYLNKVVTKEPLLNDTPLDLYITEAEKYHKLSCNERIEFAKINRRMHPRIFTEVILMVTSRSTKAGHQTNLVLVFDPTDDRWSFLTEFPDTEQVVTATTLGHDAIFCTSNTGRSWLYQMEKQVWLEKAPTLHIHEKNVGHKSATIQGSVYVPGVGRRCQNMEKYDPVTNTWSEQPTMIKAVCYHALAVCRDQMAVVGGMGNGGALSRILQVFDAEGNTWKERTACPIKTSHAAAAALDEKIYLFGNQDEAMETVYQYDFHGNGWKEVAELNTRRQRCSAIACNGRIYAIGGFMEPLWKGIVCSIECYDPKENRWNIVSQLPSAFWVQASMTLPKYAVRDKVRPLQY